MDWNQLLKHPFVNYNPGDMKNEDVDELLLSHIDEQGMYSYIQNNDPHFNLNEKNAIVINTKDPSFFYQTYEKTL
jgi:hypothetical protein